MVGTHGKTLKQSKLIYNLVVWFGWLIKSLIFLYLYIYKLKMPNAWVEHVRQYAKDNNLTYACAIPYAKASYTKKDGTKSTPSKSLPAPKPEHIRVQQLENDLKNHESNYYQSLHIIAITPSLSNRRAAPAHIKNMEMYMSQYNKIKEALERITNKTYPKLQTLDEIKKNMKKNEKEEKKREKQQQEYEIANPRKYAETYIPPPRKKTSGALL